MHNPFRYFNSSPEVIRLAVMMYVRYPLSLRQVEDLLCERGIDICHETVRYWWNRFGPVCAAEIRKRRVHHRFYSLWRWHLDEVFVRINGKTHYLWRAVVHEGEVVEVFVTKRRDRRAALEFLTRAMKRYGRPASIVTVPLETYRPWDAGRREPPPQLLTRARTLAGYPDETVLLPLPVLALMIGVHVRTLHAAARSGRLGVAYDTRTTFRRLRPRATLKHALDFRRHYYGTQRRPPALVHNSRSRSIIALHPEIRGPA